MDKNELVKITIKEDDGSSKAYFIRSKEASCLLCNVEHIAALDGLRKYETNGSSHYTRLAITEYTNFTLERATYDDVEGYEQIEITKDK